ncbi:MAG: glycosyltransferase family 9 protein [Planctomycetota bacterium]|jgi:ADP-heptose:LPS heptosyltransferase
MEKVNCPGMDEVRLYRGTRSLSDALFLSTAAHELRKRSPSTRIILETHWPQIFYGNPSVDAVFPSGPRPGKGAIPVSYEDPWPPPGRHVLETICSNLGMEGPDLRTYYYELDPERIRARQIVRPSSRPLVVVNPFSSFFAASSKQWNFHHWEKFLDLLPPEIETVRYGNPEEPATPTEREHHREMIGVDLRVFASILRNADAFVGQESGLAHLATALGVPSVVIFTGYGSPEVLGYKGNLNLVPQLPYAPCWEKDGCEPCRGEICTSAVEPEFVAENLLGLLAAGGRRG